MRCEPTHFDQPLIEVTMTRKKWILAMGFAILGLAGQPAAVRAEVTPGCYEVDSACTKGSQCCSHVCETHIFTGPTCT
jgi:hypothetical protein